MGLVGSNVTGKAASGIDSNNHLIWVISLIKLTFVVIPQYFIVEPDVVSVEQPTIRETEVFGLLQGLPHQVEGSIELPSLTKTGCNKRTFYLKSGL